jgi:hypothetical protein
MSPAQTPRIQALIALCATFVIVFLALVWTLSTHASIRGSVTLAGVCRDTTAGGVPPATRCDEAPVSGANVIVSAANGMTINIRTDGQGDFRLLLAAGSYEVGAWVFLWRGVGPSEVRGHLITGGSVFRRVTVVARSDLRMDLSLAWYAT